MYVSVVTKSVVTLYLGLFRIFSETCGFAPRSRRSRAGSQNSSLHNVPTRSGCNLPKIKLFYTLDAKSLMTASFSMKSGLKQCGCASSRQQGATGSFLSTEFLSESTVYQAFLWQNAVSVKRSLCVCIHQHAFEQPGSDHKNSDSCS